MLHSHSNHALMRQSTNTQVTLIHGHNQHSSTASLERSVSPTSQILYASSDETNISAKFGRYLYPMYFLLDLPSPTAYVRAGQMDTRHQFKSTQTVCYQPMGDLRFARNCGLCNIIYKASGWFRQSSRLFTGMVVYIGWFGANG